MLEILMVTMGATNFDVLEKSKIRSNAILANQSSNIQSLTLKNGEYLWKLVSTNTIGVGKNRNIGLNHASGPYCLLMDDDMICYDNYEERILHYFDIVKDADVLILNVNTIGKDMGRKMNKKIKRVRYWNFMNYGAVRIAFKLSSIQRENIQFHTLFGGGCLYSSGEDTFFLKNCLDAKLKIYTVPYCYADVFQNESSWYNGVNEKYIYDKGALMKAMFKHSYLFFDFIFSIKMCKSSLFSFSKIFKLMLSGSTNYSSLLSYQEYSKGRKV